MNDQLKSNLTSSKHWLRLIFMLLFAVLFQVAIAVMWVLVCIQFLFALVTGADNIKLRSFGDSLGKYIYQTIAFLTYNAEDKPFPFSDWPETSVAVDEPVEEHVDSEEAQNDAGNSLPEDDKPSDR